MAIILFLREEQMSKIKKILKITPLLLFVLVIAFIVSNMAYHLKGIDVPIINGDGESVVLSHGGVYLPGFFRIQVIEEKKLGFRFIRIYNRFNKDFDEESATVTLQKSRMKNFDLLTIHWFHKPDSVIGNNSIILNLYNHKKDPSFSFFDQTLAAMLQHGVGVNVLERPLVNGWMTYSAEFPNEVSGEALWKSFVESYDDQALTDLTESMINRTLEFTDIQQGKSKYWAVFTVEKMTDDKNVDGYSIFIISLTKEKYELEKSKSIARLISKDSVNASHFMPLP
jgi:hypothetical protein